MILFLIVIGVLSALVLCGGVYVMFWGAVGIIGLFVAAFLAGAIAGLIKDVVKFFKR